MGLGTLLALTGCSATGTAGEPTTETIASAPAHSDVSQVPPSAPSMGGTLRFGLQAENTSGWDPGSSQWGSAGQIVSRAVFDRLMELDSSGEVVPNLARSLVSTNGFRTWTITLRPGIVFHNGRPLDAAAVQRNFENLEGSLATAGTDAPSLTSTVVDDLTLQVELGAPWSTLPMFLTSQAGAIAAPEQLDSDQPAEHPIGTGPFVFERWTRDESLAVTRNPHYWQTDADGRSLPYLDRIEFLVTADPASRTAAAEEGTIDVFQSADPDQIEHFLALAQRHEFQIQTNDSDRAETQLIGLNTAAQPFDDPLARRLFVSLVDTRALSEGVYLGLFPVASGLVPESSPLYVATSYPGYDPVIADTLAAQYREQHGVPLRFTLNVPSTPQYRAVGEAIQEQARQVGVEVDLNVVLESDLVTDALLGTYQATAFVTFGQPWLDGMFISGETAKPVGEVALNLSRLADPRIDDALQVMKATDDPVILEAQWKVVQDRMADNLNYLFLVRNRSALIYGAHTFGLQSALPDGRSAPVSTTPSLTTAWRTDG